MMESCFQCDTSVMQEEYDYELGVCIYCRKLNKKWDEETYKEEE